MKLDSLKIIRGQNAKYHIIFFLSLMVNVSHVTSTNAVFISHYTPTK